MMSKSTNNIFYTKNLSLSNSLIFNNFSIQNVIISPTQYIYNLHTPMVSNNFLIKSPVYSPTPKKYHHKVNNSISIMPKKILFQNMTPLIENKSAKKLNISNVKYIQRQPLQTSPSYNNILKPKEKYPLDSKKGKNNVKKTQIFIKSNKTLLKSSASQKVIKTLKNPFVTTKCN